MRLIVLDTNVLVSAAIKPATPPGLIVRDWLLDGEVQIVTCPAILREYIAVFQRPKFHRFRFPPDWLDALLDDALQLPDPSPWPLPGDDPADLVFLALAKVAGAWLVTGNLKHFPASVRGGVTVLSPADYLTHLRR